MLIAPVLYFGLWGCLGVFGGVPAAIKLFWSIGNNGTIGVRNYGTSSYDPRGLCKFAGRIKVS